MRTFIAVDLTDTIRKRLADLQANLKPTCGNLKWVNPENVHLTIKFLGEIPDRQIAPVSEALDRLASQCQPCDITVGGLGTFAPSGPVKVLWVGIQDPAGGLEACQSLCDQLLQPLGFPPEGRRFSPHLTLARNKFPQNSRQLRAALEAEPTMPPAAQTVTGITFYQSTLTRQGPIYQPLSKHAFSA